jgi:hypothetical protein
MNGGKSEKLQAFSSLKVQTAKKQAATSNSRRRGNLTFNVRLDMACDPGAQRVQGIVEVCRQAQTGQKTFAFREGAAEEQGNRRTKQKQDSNGAATFLQEVEQQRLTKEQAVELGLLDLVAAVFELHVWGLW